MKTKKDPKTNIFVRLGKSGFYDLDRKIVRFKMIGRSNLFRFVNRSHEILIVKSRFLTSIPLATIIRMHPTSLHLEDNCLRTRSLHRDLATQSFHIVTSVGLYRLPYVAIDQGLHVGRFNFRILTRQPTTSRLFPSFGLTTR